ncbi:MAG: hypothetical protein ACJA0N_002265 [Pseudohongiellaceae bacterium]|jgi:hypothetical protein
MQQLTPAGQNVINDLSSRYNLNNDAVVHMLVAVNNGGSNMAQFNCPELGGSGQWMRGGMTMVGDMFNHGLKMTVDNLCNDLANALASTQMFPVIKAGTPGSNQWWPVDLGAPFSSGSQNNTRYAVFPNRLAVELNGQVTIYNTLDNNIGGVSQQQGGNNSLTFSSQYGTIPVNSLPVVSGHGSNNQAPLPPANFAETASQSFPQPQINTAEQFQPLSNNSQGSSNETLVLIEKLAQLKDAGVLTESEYETKKSELLARL